MKKRPYMPFWNGTFLGVVALASLIFANLMVAAPFGLTLFGNKLLLLELIVGSYLTGVAVVIMIRESGAMRSVQHIMTMLLLGICSCVVIFTILEATLFGARWTWFMSVATVSGVITAYVTRRAETEMPQQNVGEVPPELSSDESST